MSLDTAAPATAAALDAQGLARLRELDPDGQLGLLPRVTATYLQSLARLLAHASQAWDQQDAAALHYAVHTLKSSSASMGASELSQLCQQIERLAGDGNLALAGPLVARLGPEADRVRVALQALQAGGFGGGPR